MDSLSSGRSSISTSISSQLTGADWASQLDKKTFVCVRERSSESRGVQALWYPIFRWNVTPDIKVRHLTEKWKRETATAQLVMHAGLSVRTYIGTINSGKRRNLLMQWCHLLSEDEESELLKEKRCWNEEISVLSTEREELKIPRENPCVTWHSMSASQLPQPKQAVQLLMVISFD